MGVDNKFHGFHGCDRERMRLAESDGRDPKEAVLSRNGAQRSLLEGDSSGTVWQRRKGSSVVDAVYQQASYANKSIKHPDASDSNDNKDDPLGEHWLMKAYHDNGDDPAAHVDIVEELIPPPTKHRSCESNNDKGQAGNLAINHALFPKNRGSSHGRKVFGVARGVDDDKADAHVAGDLVQDVETFVRPGCEECQGGVFQGEKDEKGQIREGHPIFVDIHHQLVEPGKEDGKSSKRL